MTEKNIYPADNVDKDGVAYPTVGENIRNGNNSASLDHTTADDVNNWLYGTLSDEERMMLPIFPFSSGEWVDITDTITDGSHNTPEAIGKSSQYLILPEDYLFAIVVYSNVSAYSRSLILQSNTVIKGSQKFVINFLSPVNEAENGNVIKIKAFKRKM